MNVYMCDVGRYAYMYVCEYILILHICMHTSMCMYICINYTDIHIDVYICVCLPTCRYAYIYVCLATFIHMWINTLIYA